MRAGLGALEGRSLPWLIAEAPSIEVAADFTGIYRILMSKDCAEVKTVRFAVTKVPLEVHVRCWFGKKTFGKKTFGTKTRQILPAWRCITPLEFRFCCCGSSSHELLRGEPCLHAEWR